MSLLASRLGIFPGSKRPAAYHDRTLRHPRVSRRRPRSNFFLMRPPRSTSSDSAGDMPQQIAACSDSEPSGRPELSESPQDSTSAARRNLSNSLPSESQDAHPTTGPLVNRPTVPTSAADWESKKQIIRDLYMDQNMILNEVIDIMVAKHRFKATARMYKGQFAKWRWTKYNKSGNHSSAKLAKARAARRAAAVAGSATPAKHDKTSQLATSEQPLQLVPYSQHHLFLQHFDEEDRQVETTLGAYAALICHWSERETPWRTSDSTALFGPPGPSILQHVRAAQNHFVHGRAQLGGEALRHAFLGIEQAVENELNVDALWDCCLAVPQLVLTLGWTDMLSIFARYLHQLTGIKLQPAHPLTKIAASLHRLARQITAATSITATTNTTSTAITSTIDIDGSTVATTTAATPAARWHLLDTFVSRGWALWIDCVTRVRGPHDDVTIHLKRGYVTLVDPQHRMAGDLVRDFGAAVRGSLARRGAFATTSRILELEHLLARMFVPLFTPPTARRAEAMLTAVAAKIEGKVGNWGREVDAWEYEDRYLVFSADYFRASIAEDAGEADKAAWYRRRSLDAPRDLFWLQTSLLVEARLRAGGMHEEANEILETRVEVQSKLGIEDSELRLTGRVGGRTQGVLLQGAGMT